MICTFHANDKHVQSRTMCGEYRIYISMSSVQKIGYVTLVAIIGTATPVPYLQVKSLPPH